MWHLLRLFLVLLPRAQGKTTEKNPTTVNWIKMEQDHVPHYAHRIPTTWKYEELKQMYIKTGEFAKTPTIGPKRPAQLTPDWTAAEIPPEAKSIDYYGEFERPYRLQPMTVTARYWNSRNSFDKDDLRNILGAWYDIAWSTANNSMYMTPVRIHYHPKYIMPENVNASHPIPGLFDLAVWASEIPFFKGVINTVPIQTYICNRAGSYWLQFGSPVLGSVKQPVAIIVGFQFIMWWKRKPTPYHKYAVKTQKYSRKCPKTEWGWFFCVWGKWAVHGLDSGAALHRATQGQSWLYDGLLGLNAFSMDLRAKEMTHYFTPVENHSVLSWLYDAYMGRQDYRYLDSRFENSEWHAPTPKNGIEIKWNYSSWYRTPHRWSWWAHDIQPLIFY